MEIPKEQIKKSPVGKKFANGFLNEIADQFFKFYDLSDKELAAVLTRAKDLNDHNCGWNKYWLKDVFIRFAEDAKAERKRTKQKASTKKV